MAMWKNIAFPYILYHLEVLPFDQCYEAAFFLLFLGKSILSVRPSSAGEVVYANLGIKPIHLLIYEQKLCYVSSVFRE